MKKYVWWDEIQQHKRSRIDLRIPEPLADFLRQVAKKNGVSVNSLIVGILTYAADAQETRGLSIEIIPSVRVTERKPSVGPVDIPALPASPATRKRWKIPKVP